MTAPDLHGLYLQLGQVASNLRALSDTIEIRQTQTEKLHDLARADLAVLREDQRDLEERSGRVIEVLRAELDELRMQAARDGQAVHDLVAAVRELKQPVADIVALRARAAGLLFSIGLIGSTLLWLAEPLYRWIVEERLRH